MNAQMAESVDALVSNTSGATHPGSIPGLGTKKENQEWFSFFRIANSSWQKKDGQEIHPNRPL